MDANWVRYVYAHESFLVGATTTLFVFGAALAIDFNRTVALVCVVSVWPLPTLMELAQYGELFDLYYLASSLVWRAADYPFYVGVFSVYGISTFVLEILRATAAWKRPLKEPAHDD